MWRLIHCFNRAVRQKFSCQLPNIRPSTNSEIANSNVDDQGLGVAGPSNCISRFQENSQKNKQNNEKINVKFFDCCLKSLEFLGVTTAIALSWQICKLSSLYVSDVERCKLYLKNQLYWTLLKASPLYVLPQPQKQQQQHTERKEKVSSELEAALKDFEETSNEYVASIQNFYGVQLALSNQRKMAFNHFVTAADLGCPKALFNIAVCYEKGFGTPQDLNKAAEYYCKAAENDHPVAFYNVAVYYAQGKGGLKKDLDKAKIYFQLAADKGIKEAQTYIGIDYLKEGNWDEGLKLLQTAAEQQDHDAQFYLGVCYEHGWGTSANPAKAAHYYGKAASSGHTGALYNLAVFYENGLGGLQMDPFYAIELYQKVADKDSDAAYNLKRLKNLYEQNSLEDNTSDEVFQLDLYPDSLHLSNNSSHLKIPSSSSTPSFPLNEEKKHKKETPWPDFLNLILPSQRNSSRSTADTSTDRDSNLGSSPNSCHSNMSHDSVFFSSSPLNHIEKQKKSTQDLSSLNFLDLILPTSQSSSSSPPQFTIGEESHKESSFDSGYLGAFRYEESERLSSLQISS